MSNVLDLKNPPDVEDGSGTTTDIVTPVEALAVSAPIADEHPLSLDELTEMMLSHTAAPRAISWEADHALQGPAVRKHYALIGALTVVGGLIALWQSSLTAFLVVLAGAGALEARQRWSKPVQVGVDEHGIEIDGHRYIHADVASFDIHAMPDGINELSLHSAKWHMPNLRLPLGDQQPDEVRAVLSQYIPEGRHAIPLTDYLIRKP
jgi:hypothetical protein